MNQSLGSSQVYENAEIGDAGDFAPPGFSLGELGHHSFTLQFLPIAERFALREDQTAAVAVYFDDFKPYLLPKHGGEPPPALLLPHTPGHSHDLRYGDEAAQAAKFDDEATAIVTGNLPLIEFILFHHLLGPGPIGV